MRPDRATARWYLAVRGREADRSASAAQSSTKSAHTVLSPDMVDGHSHMASQKCPP